MSRFVRSSKFRHVFGNPAKKEHTYDGVKVSKSAWDSNKIKVNTKFLSVLWDASGGGAIAVIPLEQQGKIPASLPLVAGHKAEVLDIDFHPFNENLIASAAEDAYVKIWHIPNGGLKSTLTEPVQSLQGHKRKVGTCDFNPVANNVLATSSTDLEIKIWDIEKGDVKTTISGHSDIIQNVSWNSEGTLISTASKDKKLRIIDPRTGGVTAEREGHAGVKGSRVQFLKEGKLLSVGFSKVSERQMCLWDIRNLSECHQTENIDSAAGLLMPFFDPDTNVLYIAGKGDGNIRYYEYTPEESKLYYLTEYKSAVPQRGLGVLPKRACNIGECEIARLYKISGDGKTVEPISFQVPRKSDLFQDDLFPDTYAGEPSVTAEEWFSGKNVPPKTVSLSVGFVPKENKTEFKPVVKEESGPKNEKELRDEYEKLKTRVGYLEAELVKKDAKIKQLEGSH